LEPFSARPDQALGFLQNNPLQHIDMLEAIHRGQARLADVSGQGVMLFHARCQAWMISTDQAAAAARMLDRIAAGPEPHDLFVAHQAFYSQEIRERFGLKKTMPCHQAAYFGREPLPDVCAGTRCEILPLDERHLDFVLAHYSHISDREYLRERLRAGVMFGASVDGQLAGFIGEHDEGSLGLLEILPAWRRRGLAEALERHATNRHLAQGWTPFSQIKQGNEASLALQKKLGYTVSGEIVYWLY
jgi:GNAT superfamily N-acetyltransferase